MDPVYPLEIKFTKILLSAHGRKYSGNFVQSRKWLIEFHPRHDPLEAPPSHSPVYGKAWESGNTTISHSFAQ
jgi:hypothetical protein